MISDDCKYLKAGDKVMVCGRFGKSLCLVDKITPTGRIKVNGTYYHPEDGWQIGENAGYRTHIHPVTRDEMNEFYREHFVERVLYYCNRLTSMTYEEAVAVYNILMKEKQDEVSKL